MAGGRTLPAFLTPRPADRFNDRLGVSKHAKAFYVDGGNSTGEAENFRFALPPFALLYGAMSALSYRPKALKVFEFARALEAVPGFANAIVPQLKPAVRRWDAAAIPVIGTKCFDETWAAERVRGPPQRWTACATEM